MIAGLTADACRSDRYEGEKKLRFCNISRTVGSLIRVFPFERAKGSFVLLEKGIALAQVGQEEDALEAFNIDLRDARTNSGSWEQILHQRMANFEDQRVLEFWVSVVESAE
ncbi:hypothetical protein C1J03_06920 [Sulfitobacter sp. SK012]|nr:hypothetical protein C1J03_06920 [Sulfitobacter sp. SK012]